MRRGVAIAVAVVAVLLGASGCSGPVVHYRQINGLPAWITADPVIDGTPRAIAHSDELTVITWGSSTCRPKPASIDVAGATPTIEFQTNSAGGCTSDLAPTTFLFPQDELGGRIPPRVTVRIDGVAHDVVVQQ